MAQHNADEPRARPWLVAVGGLPGSGKSVVAGKIAPRLGGSVLRTDVIRKELFPTPTYTSAERDATYRVLFQRAAEALAAGRSVVLDATFYRRALRQRAEAIAAGYHAHWRLILVVAPESVVRKRLARRRHGPSDANFTVYRELRDRFEPVDTPHFVIDNRGTLLDLDRQLARCIDETQ